jgi:hypothetical protein
MGNTKKDLPEDIVATLYLGKSDYSEYQIKKANEIVERAKEGYYHDFDSELETPKIQLHKDLLDAGLVDIDKKMQNGDYDDESPTPEQEARLMELLESDKSLLDLLKGEKGN